MKKLVSESSGAAYLISDYFYRKYFTGFSLAEGVVIITDKETVCFTDARYYHGIKSVADKRGIKLLLLNGASSIKKYLVNAGVTVLYLDYDKTTVTEYQHYISQGFTVKDGKTALKNLRSVKTDSEIENIKKACEIIQKAYYDTLPYITAGVTERYIADLIEKACVKYGAEGMSFSTIVAFGEGSAVPHHETSDRELKDNETVLIDTGCLYQGYASDFTRTAFYGTPSEKFLKDYNAVKTANELAESTIKAGFTGKAADAVARDYFKTLSLDEYFTHSLGHGLGLEIHEEPRLSKAGKSELKENTVFTIEPGLYFTGEYGIRIEDTCVIKDGVTRRLFTDSKELIILK